MTLTLKIDLVHWRCKRCKSSFSRSLSSCPFCTASSVEEIFLDTPDVPETEGVPDVSGDAEPSSGASAPEEASQFEAPDVPETEGVPDVSGDAEPSSGASAPEEASQFEETPKELPGFTSSEAFYQTRNKDQLKAECSVRGLSVSGSKQALIGRLVEQDRTTPSVQ